MKVTPQRLVDNLRLIRGVAPQQRLGVARTVVNERFDQLRYAARQQILRSISTAADSQIGYIAGNRAFWRSPGIDPNWADVRARVDLLTKQDPTSLVDFVHNSILHTTNPAIVIRLARYPFSADAFRGWLLDGALVHAARARLIAQHQLGGAVIGAARLLLKAEEFEGIRGWVLDLYAAPPVSLFRVNDSVGWQPLADGKSPHTVGHRLIITDSIAEQDSIALLLPGAKRATVFAASDTYGKADLDQASDWPGVGKLSVEHVRSRVTRFSQEYIDLHEATRCLAEEIARNIGEVGELLHDDDRPFLEVRIADFIFFQSLKIRAIELLLEDATFDHVVIALDNSKSAIEFARLLSGIDRLALDPRVEFVSIAHSPAHRSRFWELVDVATAPSRALADARTQLPQGMFARKVADLVDPLARRLGSFDQTTAQRSCLMVTANNPAYIESTAFYIDELRDEYETRVLHLGANALELVAQLDDSVTTKSVIDFLAPEGTTLNGLADNLAARLIKETSVEGETHHLRLARHAGVSSMWRLCRSTILPSVVGFLATRRWFDRLEKDGQLPDVVVLTPQRNPVVSQMAAVARGHKVPSIALEPHAQDANYSRYTKVSADYYGVMSDYFRTHASVGFGIDQARVRSIGSPRQIAPQGHDPVQAQRSARERFHADTGVDLDQCPFVAVYFDQPSQWAHASQVWQNILDAARDTGAVVLLKPHGETSPSRTQRYMAMANGDVHLIGGDAANAVALADISLTAYSSAAIDSAVRQTPVICVTDGSVDYPLDMAAIVGAPFARSAQELAEMFASYIDDPEHFQDQALQLLRREPQFTEGPGPGLRSFVADAIRDGESGLRPAASLPPSLFLDGPHPTFSV